MVVHLVDPSMPAIGVKDWEEQGWVGSLDPWVQETLQGGPQDDGLWGERR